MGPDQLKYTMILWSSPARNWARGSWMMNFPLASMLLVPDTALSIRKGEGAEAATPPPEVVMGVEFCCALDWPQSASRRSRAAQSGAVRTRGSKKGDLCIEHRKPGLKTFISWLS